MGTVTSIHVHDQPSGSTATSSGRGRRFTHPDKRQPAAADQSSPGVAAATVESAVDAVFAELERLEQMFSTFRPTSVISQLNRGELVISDCPAEVIDVLDACTWLNHRSGGAFTIEPPDRPGVFDPAGFVKGWATERAASLLTAAELHNWYVSTGGDAQTSGRPAPDRPWTAAIAAPGRPDEVLALIEIPPGGAIATSGLAERGDHLWSPHPHDLVSFTVTGPRLTWADAFATTGFAMGHAGVPWVATHSGYQAWALTPDGEVLSTT